MHRIHRITATSPATTTVNAVIEDLYDVRSGSGTGSLDTDRRDGAARALRDLNPTLPTDETPFSNNTIPFVRARFIARSPWRIPPATGSLRADLASLGIRNVDVLVNLDPTWARPQLSGPPSLADVERLQAIAGLMRVSGLDASTAAFLYDHTTTPIQSIAELAEVDPEILKGMVEEHVTAGFPAALLDDAPWNRWPRHAQRMRGKRRSQRLNVAPLPFSAGSLSTEAASWKARAGDETRTAAERSSAGAITAVLDLQATLMRANAALATGDARTAWTAYREFHATLGNYAVAATLIQADSEEATGPSLETVLGLCRVWLDTISPEDSEATRVRLGGQPLPAGDGLRAFSLSELQSGSAGTVTTALGSHPASVLGGAGAAAIDRAFSEQTKGGITTTALTQGIGTPNTSSRMLDLAPDDAAQFRQNVRTVNLGTLQTSHASAWTAATKAFTLRDVRAAVGTSLNVGGSTPAATAVLTGGVYPTTLTENMGPFDRFVAYTPSRRRSATRRYVPVSSSFAARYRLDVLQPLYAEGKVRTWQFKKDDFADPGRFAFILPQLYLRQVRMAMARTAAMAAPPNTAEALRASAWITSADFASPLSTSLHALINAGTVASANHDVNCDNYTDQPDLMDEELHALNLEADVAYQQGEYSKAQRKYEKVIAVVEQCTTLTATTLSINFSAVHADIKARAYRRDPTLHPWAMFDYTVDEDGVATSVFGDAVVLLSSEWQATDRTVAAGAMTARGLDLGASRVRYYVDGVGLEVAEKEEANDRGTSGDGLDDDLDDDEFPWPPGGGGTIIPPCGTSNTTVEIIDADAVLAELLHAQSYLAQLKAGLNWLGFDPETVPAWRFDYLLDRARYFAAKADEVQQRSMSVLLTADSKRIEEIQAQYGVLIAQAGTEVALAQQEVAAAQVVAAQESLEAANNQVKYTSDDVGWAVVGAAGAVAGGALSGLAFGPVGAVVGGVAAAASSAGQIDAAAEGHKAAEDAADVAAAQLDVAAAQQAVAVEQVALATLQAELAQAVADELSSQDGTSADLFQLLEEVERVGRSYLLMANRLAWLAERAFMFESRRSASYIQMSYEVENSFQARFGGAVKLSSHVDALEHARVVGTSNRYQILKVTVSLFEHDPTQLILLRETGRCVYRMPQQQLDERYPGLYLHSLRRVEVELDGVLPSTGLTGLLRTTSNTLVRVPYGSDYASERDALGYDWAYPEGGDAPPYPDDPDPGPERVYDIDAEPGSETEAAPPYVMKALLGGGFAQVLSEYRANQDGGVLSPPSGALDAFEHLSPAALWSLELPRTGNGVSYENISDVRFVLYFTAAYDGALQAAQEGILASSRVSRALLLSGTEHAAGSFAALTTTPSDTGFRDVRILPFEVSESLLPANLKERVHQNVLVYFATETTTPIVARLRATPRPVPVAGEAGWGRTDDIPDAMFYSAIGLPPAGLEVPSGVTYGGPTAGDFPDLDTWTDWFDNVENSGIADAPADILGTWSLKFLPEDNPDWLLKDDDGDDVEVSTGVLTLTTDGATARYDDGSWKHAQVRIRFKIATGGALYLRLRDASGTQHVFGYLAPAGLAVGQRNGSTTPTNLATAGSGLIIADEWTEATLRVVEAGVTLDIDGVEVLTSDAVTVTAAGSICLEYDGSSGSVTVSDVVVTRLRYDGTELEDVVSETFSTGTSSGVAGWTASTAWGSGVAWAAETHNLVDLSALADILLQIDYTALYDVASSES